jgi:hypothetical protein
MDAHEGASKVQARGNAKALLCTVVFHMGYVTMSLEAVASFLPSQFQAMS